MWLWQQDLPQQRQIRGGLGDEQGACPLPSLCTHTHTHTRVPQRHGEGTMWYSTGQVYKGEFFNDLPHGEGEIRYSSRCKYHGSWLHGLVSVM